MKLISRLLVLVCFVFASQANANCTMPVPQIEDIVSKDLEPILNAAQSACDFFPEEDFSPALVYELSKRYFNVQNYIAFSLADYKRVIDEVCSALSEEDAQINLEVRLSKTRGPTDLQRARKLQIFKALQYCAYDQAGIPDYLGNEFVRKPVFWEHLARLSELAAQLADRSWNRYSDCKNDPICRTGRGRL